MENRFLGSRGSSCGTRLDPVQCFKLQPLAVLYVLAVYPGLHGPCAQGKGRWTGSGSSCHLNGLLKDSPLIFFSLSGTKSNYFNPTWNLLYFGWIISWLELFFVCYNKTGSRGKANKSVRKDSKIKRNLKKNPDHMENKKINCKNKNVLFVGRFSLLL